MMMKNRHLFALLLSLALPALAEPTPREMEQALAKSLQAVRESRLDVAMNEVDELLRINPNFKLAQLVKGDLLLARARPLSEFGNAPGASREKVQELREEANARLLRAQQQQPIAVPKYLWQLSPQQRYAVVVDTSKSTLYLYENVGGEPRYVADFYITHGKKGADKNIEGDQKTPLGVYFVNDFLPKKKLSDFYGSGAYPINYPNEWDQRLGRNGHGIWLHGVPSDTYSRPPRASNGCVVLSNDDLLLLGRHLQVGVTPVIITREMDWSDAETLSERDSLLLSFEQWRRAWNDIDTETYLSYYAADFTGDYGNHESFARQKRLVNAGKTWVRVKLYNLSMLAYPNQPGLVVVDFEQEYDSNNHSNHMHKRQYWMKRDGRWQIVYEGAA